MLQRCPKPLVMFMNAACKCKSAGSCQPLECFCVHVLVCMMLFERACLNVPVCLPG